MSPALRGIALVALLLLLLTGAWLLGSGGGPEPERAEQAPTPRIDDSAARDPGPPPEPLAAPEAASLTEPTSPAEQVSPVEPVPSAERVSTPLERILTVPEGLATRHGAPPRAQGYTPAPGEQPVLPEWVDPSLSGGTTRVEGLAPSDDIESREVRGGVTVSPGKTAERAAPAAVKIEGGARERVSEGAQREPERQGTVGVSIEVPWPGERKP